MYNPSGDPNYVTDQAIHDAIAILNKNYESACISFYFAKVAPSGYCFPGINRVATPQYVGSFSDQFNQKLIKYDAQKYLNIYIYESMSGGLEGFANQPSTVLGTSPLSFFTPTTFFELDAVRILSTDMSNLLTHEIGHWLDLFHTWGPDNNNIPTWTSCHPLGAFNGDFIDDTNPMTKPDDSFTDCVRSSCSSQYNDPSNNWMGYTFGCSPQFTAGQISRMHGCLDNFRQTIWSSSNIASTGGTTGKFIGGDIQITGSLTNWTKNTFSSPEVVIDGILTIKNGARLFIRNGLKVKFCKGSKILVENGGGLFIIEGAIVQALASDWIGIQNYGTTAIYNNSSIEDADIGIEVFSGASANIASSFFKDNKISIKYNPGSLKSTVNESKFTNDNASITAGFDCFIQMDRTDEKYITGCTFTGPSGGGMTVGIKATSSFFSVDKSTYLGLKSEFHNLFYGIYCATSAQNQPFKLRNSLFKECQHGIFVDNVHFSKTTYTEFEFNNAMGPFSTGAYFNNSVLQTWLEANTFKNANEEYSSAGILWNKTGFGAKDVYRNKAYRRSTMIGTENNGISTSGVNFTCNDFYTQSNAIRLESTGTFRTMQGQRVNPNSPDVSPTRNKYHVNIATNIMNWGLPIFYVHYNVPLETPTTDGAVNLLPRNSLMGAACPTLEYEDDVTLSNCCSPVVRPCCGIDSKIEALYTDFEGAKTEISNLKVAIDNSNNSNLQSELQSQLDIWKAKYEALKNAIIHYYYFTNRNQEEDMNPEIRTAPQIYGKDLLYFIEDFDNIESYMWKMKEKCMTTSGIVRSSLNLDFTPYSISLSNDYINTIAFSQVFEIAKKGEIENINLDDMATIQSIAQSTENTIGRSWARAIMTSKYGTVYPPDQIINNAIPEETMNRNSISNKSLLYPNPSNNLVNLDLSRYSSLIKGGKDIIFDIYDLRGNVVITQNIINPFTTLSIDKLNSGVYLYKLKISDKTHEEGKLIKIE